MHFSKNFIQEPASPPADSGHQERFGKDEMNLVEHPFALLKRTSDSVLEMEWEKRHPHTGKILKASWRVEGSGELGLPGPAEERLYLVLMELSREQNWPRRITFSQSDLLRRLGVGRGKHNYKAIHDSFLRLKSVTIDAKRSFWKKDIGDFAASLQFDILDEVEIIDEPRGRRAAQVPLALSSFTWSRVLHKSFAAGNVRSLHIDFALSLQLPLAARLFRYLDKHRTGDMENLRHKYEIELHRLCEIHLGMKPVKYASKLKERLLPALTELKERNFLVDWAFEPMKSASGCEKIVFCFANGVVMTRKAPVLPPLELSESQGHPEAFVPLLSVLLPIEQGDDEIELLDAACDRVFAALDEDEKAEIHRQALAALPEFLQNNQSTPSAQRSILKEKRAGVWNRHKAAIYAELEKDNGKE